MPNKKVIAISIVCASVVVSLWLFERSSSLAENTLSTQKSVASESDVSVDTSVRPYISTSTDWQNILSSGSWNDASVTSLITPENDPSQVSSGEGTLTDQMAKDFFGQYLQLSQGGHTVTDDEATQIAQNTLALPDYTTSVGVQYTVRDLHVNPETSKELVIKYKNDLAAIIKNRTPKNNGYEMDILTAAVKSGKESDLAPLDPLIAADKLIISDLLAMNIPSDAVGVHLGFINASSNILENTEAMRVNFSDPVRSFAGVSQYGQHVSDMVNALNNLNAYLKAKIN